MKKPSIPVFGTLAILLAVLAGQSASLSARQGVNPTPAPAGKSIPVPLPKGKKLILKDGTIQVAREYSVEGDRVRYWSLERSDWEEIPAAMVDWDATNKSEAEQAARDTALKAKIHASDIAERTKDIDVDLSLQIKPGLFLPDGIGLYALDRDSQVRQMKQSNADVKVSAGREVEKIMTGVPFIPGKKTMQIPGERAALRIKTAEPEFFMRPSDDREPRFHLLRAQVKGGRRVLDDISVLFTGEEKHKANDIAIQTWTPARGVFRYTVEQRLEPGEYAFIEMTDEGPSGYVWDFGIDLPGTKTSK
ncbi:MAG: hypothetical protein LAO19_15435 [Acidobacteriia bacterium]|nr:hypothetical protein [Terriglobia bacterium]